MPTSPEAASVVEPRFAVRIERGLVTHWQEKPLVTWEDAEWCRESILEHLGEQSEIEKLILYTPDSAEER